MNIRMKIVEKESKYCEGDDLKIFGVENVSHDFQRNAISY